MEPSMILMMLLSAWIAFTAVLVILLIYRAQLSSREDDQMFIDVAERLRCEEQKELIAKLGRLRKPIVALSASSAVLFMAVATFWVYQGLKN